MDHLSHTGRKIGRIKQDTEDALRRDISEYPLVHRIRDVFDNVLPFEFEFDTPSTEHTSYLNLNFSPPPPPCQSSSESTVVVMGCYVGACETYLNVDTGSVLDTTHPFVSGTVSVYINDVETTQYTITDTDTITLTHDTSAGDVVNVYYVYQATECAEPNECVNVQIYDTFTRTEASSWGSGEIGTWTNSGAAVFTRSVNGTRGIIQANSTASNVAGSNANATIAIASNFAIDLDFEFADFDPNPYQFRPNLLIQFIDAPGSAVEADVQIFPINGLHNAGPEISAYSGSVYDLSSGLNSGHIRIECTTTTFSITVNDAFITSPYINSFNNPATLSSGTPGRIRISLVQSSLETSPISSTFKVYIDNITIGTNCIFV